MGTLLLLETMMTMMMLYVASHFACDVLCSCPIINQHKSGRESKRECFVVSLLHFQGSVSTFPTVEWRGGSKRPDMYSVRMGTWNSVEISRAMFVILRQRTRPILRQRRGWRTALESWWVLKTKGKEPYINTGTIIS